MFRFLSLAFLSLFSLSLILSPINVSAQDIGLEVGSGETKKSLGEVSGLADEDVRITAVQVINVLLSLLGIICLSLIVYAGFKWMTAGGNDEDIATAKKTLWAAVIGLIIILSAWSITTFVLQKGFQSTAGNVVDF